MCELTRTNGLNIVVFQSYIFLDRALLHLIIQSSTISGGGTDPIPPQLLRSLFLKDRYAKENEKGGKKKVDINYKERRGDLEQD